MISKYARTNSKEWFAENFAAYVLGRRDLVDPAADALITRIFNREF